MNDWTAIFETAKPYEAEMIKDILDNNGIESVILNQQDSSYKLFGNVYVMVQTEDSEKATEILKSNHCE